MGSKNQTQTILENLIDRYEELQRLRKLAAIAAKHPEWLEQEPEIQELIKPVA
jgi:hypothetical protein